MKKEPEQRIAHWLGAGFNIGLARKVGLDPHARLTWLATDFVNQTSATLEERLMEMALFIVFESGAGSVNLSHLPPVSETQLKSLIADVGKRLNGFVDGQIWELKIEKRMVRRLHRRVEEFPPNKGKLQVWCTWSREWGVSDQEAFCLVFLLTIQDLLAREGATLMRCMWHECRNLFVQEDARQKYCSDNHAHKDRQLRYRTGRTVGETK